MERSLSCLLQAVTQHTVEFGDGFHIHSQRSVRNRVVEAEHTLQESNLLGVRWYAPRKGSEECSASCSDRNRSIRLEGFLQRSGRKVLHQQVAVESSEVPGVRIGMNLIEEPGPDWILIELTNGSS